MSDLMPVEQWQREHPDDATPPCPKCGRHLGVFMKMWSSKFWDVWLCEECDETFDPENP
jgi:ribosomal protein L37AE/L43A